MRRIRRVAFALFVAVCAAGSVEAQENQPNVLLIVADDLGWRDLGCTGSEFYETPRIDDLAASGTRFTNGYAACQVCSPTRAAIVTGKYPARLNTTDWFGAPQPETVDNHWTRDKPLLPAPYLEHLPLEEVTVAEAFKEAGYATYFAGKWHLGGKGYFPEDQGFDVNKGGHHRGSPPGGYFSPYRNPKLTNGPEGEHLPARLAEETAGFIGDHADEPFFAMVSFYSVHTPLQARDDLTAKYREKRGEGVPEDELWGEEGARKVRLVQQHPVYAGMVEAMDTAVGTVLDALEEHGVAENTIVVFTSDNGGLSTSEGHPTSNLPLRAGKGWMYEGGLRVPLIIRWPGVADDGATTDVPAISTDLYPTLLAAAGLPARPDQHVDGMNLEAVLRGENPVVNRSLYWHYPHYGNQGGSPTSAIRDGTYKLIHFYEDGRNELYNLAEDVGEENDLAEAHPDVAAHMFGKLEAWQQAVGAREPSANPEAE